MAGNLVKLLLSLYGTEWRERGYGLSGKIYAPGDPSLGLKEDILFLETVNFYSFEGASKLRWAGGAQRPVGRVNEPNKTGARSARARTRGQNPLVNHRIINS